MSRTVPPSDFSEPRANRVDRVDRAEPGEALLAGRYRLYEVLSRNAAVSTFGGIDTRDDHEVVVKELCVRGLDRWKEYDLFEREIETLSSLDHPGLPRLIDHFRLEGDDPLKIYLVMERIAGEPLSAGIARGRVTTTEQARRILDGALEILEYLHALAPPVVHRDIKPANLLVRGNDVFLVDFGGVKRYLPWGSAGSTIVGTLGYFAPEQLHGEATPATDIYSLGATIAALVAGCEADRLPREGLRIDLARIPALRPELAALLERMVEPDPHKRIRSARHARTLLAEPEAAVMEISIYDADLLAGPEGHGRRLSALQHKMRRRLSQFTNVGLLVDLPAAAFGLLLLVLAWQVGGDSLLMSGVGGCLLAASVAHFTFEVFAGRKHYARQLERELVAEIEREEVELRRLHSRLREEIDCRFATHPCPSCAEVELTPISSSRDGRLIGLRCPTCDSRTTFTSSCNDNRAIRKLVERIGELGPRLAKVASNAKVALDARMLLRVDPVADPPVLWREPIARTERLNLLRRSGARCGRCGAQSDLEIGLDPEASDRVVRCGRCVRTPVAP